MSGCYSFKNQDFNSLRNWCLRQGCLFEDPYFKLDRNYDWLRPYELSYNPQLYVGGIARFDVIQGELGDCWMLASISAIGKYPELVQKIIPSGQDFSNNYAGIFHFHFWQFGRWYDVVIDDRLPTSRGQLVFTKSVSQNEYWTALLEKAYCKILGGEYKVADAGNLCEALEDFTGGVVEQYLLSNTPRNFENTLVKSVLRKSLIGVFIDDDPGQSESHTDQGLVRGHSYTVTDARRVSLPGYGKLVLVRVRNPWGKHEWTGAWSDGSPEWNAVPQGTKRKLGLVDQDDGEFWMSYDDFVSHFQWMDMCHLDPEAFVDAYGTQEDIPTWSVTSVRGSWVRGVTTGGARMLSQNPQIRFTLDEADDDNHDGYCSVLISLLQKTSGCQGDQLEIGFKVYALDYDMDQTLDQYFFQNNRAVADVPTKTVREVAGRFNLVPGAYCIVPFTYESWQEGEFLIRIYSEKCSGMDQMDYRIGLPPVDITATNHPPMMTRATGKSITEDQKVVIDENMKKFFEEVSGADKEVDWKELKGILDNARTEDNLTSKEPEQGLTKTILHHIKMLSPLAVVLGSLGKIAGHKGKPNAFSTIGPEGFSYDLCRSMVALMDIDHSGKLGLNEFQDLWLEIKKWKTIYEQFCEKEDGFLSSAGLKDALEAAGFRFNRQTLTDIIHRYSSRDGKVSFDDFLQCSVKVKKMSDIFKAYTVKPQKAGFSLDEFMSKVLYC